MKALTIHQPWNWLIAHGHKPVENRVWTPPKGSLGTRIALHAGKTLDREAVDELSYNYPLPEGYVLGAVEAVATLTGWVNDECRGARAPGCNMTVMEAAREHDLYCGPIGWVLTDVVALPEPVPCRGFQKLWTLPHDVERAVLAQLEGRRPSHINLRAVVPLTDVFGRVEREVAAAYVLLAMVAQGDSWEPVLPTQVGAAVRAADPAVYGWTKNPFCIPNFEDLIAHGFACLVDESAGRSSPMAFTDKGRDALLSSAWVTP